jgi:F-type H+-transporting ATPase subunit b
MIYLSGGSELINPGVGLVFWMLITFVLLLILLKKFAWKPILGAIKSREDSISEALSSAETARREMQNLTAQNEKLLAEARAEREIILKEAREMRKQIVEDARVKGEDKVEKMLEQAKDAIQKEKQAVMFDMRNQISELAVEISEKVLRSQLENKDAQATLITNLLKDTKLN